MPCEATLEPPAYVEFVDFSVTRVEFQATAHDWPSCQARSSAFAHATKTTTRNSLWSL